MSLINKMLQDLDARGVSAGADPALVKPILRPENKLAPRVAVAVIGVAAVVVAVWYGRTLIKPRAAPGVATAAMPLAKVPAGMVRVTPPQPAPVPVATPVPEVVAVAEVKPVRAVVPVKPAPQEPEAVTHHVEKTVQRGSEAEYRHALGELQDGRVTEAIAALEHTVQIDPRHDAARQTLVGLLVEAHRNDDAMRQLQLGLGLDPRQPAMAMLLARLQLETGNQTAAVDTLQRTLPYATGNGDYQAFLGGVLQRLQRNGEAVTQYQAALAITPGNAVWLMGLGIALQADKRNLDALAAFQQAGAMGTLAPELQAFVERKARQLKP